jgi:hypothetical protein
MLYHDHTHAHETEILMKEKLHPATMAPEELPAPQGIGTQ